jgi:hypothetical protein
MKKFMTLALAPLLALSAGLHATEASTATTAPVEQAANVTTADEAKLSAALDGLTKELDNAAKQIVESAETVKTNTATTTAPVEQAASTETAANAATTTTESVVG